MLIPPSSVREDWASLGPAASPSPGLPFDHYCVVSLAVARLRDSYRLSPDPDQLLSSPFTLLELRRLHQAVLGQELPKDTFRRHMQPLLKATGRHKEGEVGKPALLFRHLGPA